MNKLRIFFCLAALAGCQKKAVEPEPAKPATQTKGQAQNELNTALERVEAAPHFDNYISLGLAYEKLKLHHEALAAFKEAATLNPASESAVNHICSQYMALRDWKNARASCKSAGSLKQIKASTLKLKEEAARIRRSLPRLRRPELTDARLSLGYKLFELQEYEEAIRIWSQVPKDDPKYSFALNNLASANISLKRYALAEKQLNEAEKLDPKNPLIAENRRWLKEVSGK